MKYSILLLSMLLDISLIVSGQSNSTEHWRDMGYQLKLKEDYGGAIEFYNKILSADNTDYDARLALAKLYTINDNCDSAIFLFSSIYKNDSTDVEAMNGLGDCYSIVGKENQSVMYYEKALIYLPDNIDQLFFLAKAYRNAGKLDKAIDVYEQINRIDDTWAEAWAGIGKIFYWKDMPASSVSYYKKALQLDPGNEEIKDEYQKVLSELKFGLTVKISALREQEESYLINALIGRMKIEKRISDHWSTEVNFLLDKSNRKFEDKTLGRDTLRWYNTSVLKTTWIHKLHRVSLFGGYSHTDNKFSAYGLIWSAKFSIGKINLQNTLSAGYEYFYYWNEVGATSFTDEVSATYKFFSFNARYSPGFVDDVMVEDVFSDSSYSRTNPFNFFGFSMTYSILANPQIKIGLKYSWLNYEYKSSLYYSPFARNLTGALVTVYYPYKKFFAYGSFSYNLGNESNYEKINPGEFQKTKINVNNWTYDFELGYNYYPFSFSAGGSSFYNPYYQNLTGFVSVKVLF